MLETIAIWVGYLASVFLIISLVVTTNARFRIYNMMGCLSFMIYAFILKAWPVFIPNLILFIINIYYLRQIYTRHEKFDMVAFGSDDQIARKFLGYYMDDIKTYYPDFQTSQLEGNLNFIILRDLAVANIFSAEPQDDGDALVQLNYTAKQYRDFKVGTFLFNKERDFLLQKGIRRVVYRSMNHKGHIQFLKKMGFKQIEMNGEQGFVLNIQS